jgi:hypothetical protein
MSGYIKFGQFRAGSDRICQVRLVRTGYDKLGQVRRVLARLVQFRTG